MTPMVYYCRSFQRVLFVIAASFAVLACSDHSPKSLNEESDVVVIFQDFPDQSSADIIGQSLHQAGFEQVCAIDATGDLLQFNPRTVGNDTINIPSFAGYSELMLQYQGIEWDYYLLKAGDSVLVSYNDMLRPHLISKTSDENTKLYNLPFRDPRAVHANGYSSSGILSSEAFQAWHRYYIEPSAQRKYPELKQKFDLVHVDLDSLSIIYDQYLEDFKHIVDSLESSGEAVYADYYRRAILGESDYSPKDVIKNDSLMHYIRNFRKALNYPIGENSPEKFEFMLSDTVATPMARNMILKKLVNDIKNSDYWVCYPDALIKKYVNLYVSETGDSSVVQDVISTPNVSDTGGFTYDLVLEDEAGKRTTLDELVSGNRGNVIFIDFWASWCGPCRGEMPKAKEIRRSFANSDVSFIYVSVDSNSSDWKKAVKECETSSFGGKNYLLLNGEESLFMKQIKAMYIPQYVMIDKEGKVVDTNAPRPTSGKLEEAIMAIL